MTTKDESPFADPASEPTGEQAEHQELVIDPKATDLEGRIVAIYKRIDGCNVAKKALAAWCGLSGSTIGRNLSGKGVPTLGAAKALLDHLRNARKKAGKSEAHKLLAKDPSIIDDLESAIRAIMAEQPEQPRQPVRIPRDPVIVGKLGRMGGAPVREDFEIDISIGHDPAALLRGYRPETAQLSWKAEFPPGEVCISFVANEEALRSEFKRPNCIYRTIDDEVAALANEDPTKQVFAELKLDGEECPCRHEFSKDKRVLRFYFEQPKERPGARLIEIVTRCRMRLNVTHLNVKFDSYHIRGKCKISMTPPVPVESLEHFQFSGPNHLVSEHDELWRVKTINELNKFEAESQEQRTLAGSGIYFTWEFRYELLPVKDLELILPIAKRVATRFEEKFACAPRGAPFDRKLLDHVSREGYLVGLHQSSTPKPADGDEPRRDQTSLVGFVACTKVATEDGEAMHLEHIAILPEIQESRRGQRLVARVLAVAKASGAQHVSLISYDREVPVQHSFFTRLGFEQIADDDLTPAERALLKLDVDALPEKDGARRVVMRHDFIGIC